MAANLNERPLAQSIHTGPTLLAGEWRTRTPWTWEGVAECEADISGLSLIREGRSISWTRAARSRLRAVPIVVRVFPYDAEDNVQVNIKVGEQDGICRHQT